MRLAIFFIALLLIVGCAKSSDNSSTSSQAPSAGKSLEGSNGPENLKVYCDGENPTLNNIQVVNQNPGQSHFDFTYQPQEDEELTLTNVKSYLIGCKDSDIALEFNLLHLGPDGKVDLSGYEELGTSPIMVRSGHKYIVRANLSLRTNCLGIAYYFGVQEFH